MYPEAALSSASRITDSTPAPFSLSDRPLLTQDTVARWVQSWQRRLGLSEWRIEAKIVRLTQLPKGTVANIHWSLPKRAAIIKVLDPLDSTVARHLILRDTELSVIHELVHLSMAKLPLDAGNTDLEEEAVKKLSAALLALEEKNNESVPH